MGKNRYGGTEVYVSKLEHGTKFEVMNGVWESTLLKKDGIPRLMMGDGTVMTVEENFIANVVTKSPIPTDAYVYPSALTSDQYSFLPKKIEDTLSRLRGELLDDAERQKVLELLEDSKKGLETLISVVSNLPNEEFH